MVDLKARIGDRRSSSPRSGPQPEHGTPATAMKSPLLNRIDLAESPPRRTWHRIPHTPHRDRYLQAGKSSTNTSPNSTGRNLLERIGDTSPSRPGDTLLFNGRDTAKPKSRFSTDNLPPVISPRKPSDPRPSVETISTASVPADKTPLFEKSQPEPSVKPQGTLLQETLLPLVIQNAQRREAHGWVNSPDEIRGRLRQALTKEFCETLAENMRSIQQQMQKLNPGEMDSCYGVNQSGAAEFNTGGALLCSQSPHKSRSAMLESDRGVGVIHAPESLSLSTPPKAPRAMRGGLEEKIGQPPTLKDSVLSRDDHNGFVFYGTQPQHADVQRKRHNSSTAAPVMETNSSHTQGIAIPTVDWTSKEVSDNTAIPKERGFSNSYRNRPSSLRSSSTRGRYSPSSTSRFTPVFDRGLQNYTVDSFHSSSRYREYRSRSRSPNARSHRVEDPSTPSRLSDRSPRPLPRRYRSPDTHRHKLPPRRMPAHSLPNSSTCTLPSQSQTPIFLDRKPSSFSHAERKQPVQSSQQIAPSRSHHTPTTMPIYSDSQPPTPAQTIKDESDADDSTVVQRSPSVATLQKSLEPIPCHNVPGLWLEKMGHDQADVYECEFQVDSVTALKWGIPNLSAPSRNLSGIKCSLQLLCLSKDSVQTVHDKLRSSPMHDSANTSAKKIEVEWPSQGSLIVQMNPTNKLYGRSWLPDYFAPTSPALDVTGHVGEGQNILRLIQLDNMADKVFVLYATPSATRDHPGSFESPIHLDVTPPIGFNHATVEIVF